MSVLRIFSTFSSLRPVEGRPELSESETEVFPRSYRQSHLKVCILSVILSSELLLIISCFSDAVFPSLKQIFTQRFCPFKSDISFVTANRGSHLTRTKINNRWEPTERVVARKVTRLNLTLVIQLHLLTESYTIWSSRSRQPVWKRLDTPS
jgi:hypothetical protein